MAEHQIQWVNRLPGWIFNDPRFTAYGAMTKGLLQTMANRATKPDGGGNLMSITGGHHLWESAGMSRSSFWRHFKKLVDAGFVVVTCTGFKVAGVLVVSTYAIPGAHDSLRGCKRSRRHQRMVHQGGSVFVPVVIEKGSQDDLFAAIPHNRQEADSDTAISGAPHSDTTPSVTLTLPLVSERGAIHPRHQNTSKIKTRSRRAPHNLEANRERAELTRGESKIAIERLGRWLRRIGWKSGERPGNVLKLIQGDVTKALEARERYATKEAEILESGTLVENEAALWDSIWEGRL